MTSFFDNVDIVKSGKNFRIPSGTTLQHSIFDRKRQIYLLKYVNRCTYTFRQSLGEWLYIVHCHKWRLIRPDMTEKLLTGTLSLNTNKQINGDWEGDGQVSVWNGASVLLQFNLFDQNVQNKHKHSECNHVIGLFNLKMNNSGRYNRFGYLNEM